MAMGPTGLVFRAVGWSNQRCDVKMSLLYYLLPAQLGSSSLAGIQGLRNHLVLYFLVGLNVTDQDT